MIIDSSVLAARICAASTPSLPESMVPSLAVALSNGSGIALGNRSTNGQDVVVVLRNPLEIYKTDGITIARGVLPLTSKLRKFRTTTMVANTITTAFKPGKLNRTHPTYAPTTSANPQHYMELKGRSLNNAAATEISLASGKTIVWRNLNDVPVGEFVHFTQKAPVINEEIVLFQRVGPDHWVLVRFDGRHDVADLPLIMRTISDSQRPHADITGLSAITAEPTLLRAPSLL